MIITDAATLESKLLSDQKWADSKDAQISVFRFLSGSDQYQQASPAFTMRLARTVSGLVNNDKLYKTPELEGIREPHLLDNLHEFMDNYLGAVETISIEDPASFRLGLHDCMGNIAKRRFTQTQDQKWAEDWYDHKFEASEIANPSHPRRSGVALNSAAKVANKLYKKLDNPGWLKISYDSAKLGAQRLAGTGNNPLTVNVYLFACDQVCSLLVLETDSEKKEEYSLQYYECAKQAHELASTENARQYMKTVFTRGHAAANLAKLPKYREMRQEAIRFFREIVENPHNIRNKELSRLQELSKVSLTFYGL